MIARQVINAQVINVCNSYHHQVSSLTLPWVHKVGTIEWFCPEGFQAFKLCRGVQLYPHEDWDEPPYPCPGKGCLTFSNLSLIRSECHMKGSTGSRSMSWRNPLASFMDKLVEISYLACRPHPRHVVCTGGYSDSRIPINGP